MPLRRNFVAVKKEDRKIYENTIVRQVNVSMRDMLTPDSIRDSSHHNSEYKSHIDDEFAVMVKTKSFKRKAQMQRSAAAVNCSSDNRQTPLKFQQFDMTS